MQKRGQKDWKRQRNRKFAVRLGHLGMSQAVPKVSLTWVPRHKMNKDNTKRHADIERRKPRRPPPYSKNHRELWNAGAGQKALPRKEYTSASIGQHRKYIHANSIIGFVFMGEGLWEDWKRGKGRGKLCNYSLK